MSPALQEDSLPTEPPVKPKRSSRVGSRVYNSLSIEEQDPLENTLVYLPGEFYGQRSLVGYIFQGVAKESDMT